MCKSNEDRARQCVAAAVVRLLEAQENLATAFGFCVVGSDEAERVQALNFKLDRLSSEALETRRLIH